MNKEEKFDVVGLGQCSWDILGRTPRYPALDQKAELQEMIEQGGGPVATALVTLARLGVSTTLMGTVGDDLYGSRIRQGLLEENVDCSGLTEVPGSSQVAFIAVDDEGHRNIFWHRGSAQPLQPEQIAAARIVQSGCLHLDGLHLEPAICAARIARKAGVMTVLDAGTLRPGIENLLPMIDHIVVSEMFAQQAVGDDGPDEALVKLSEWGARSVTITGGKGGSLTRTADGDAFHQPAFPVKPVDTTGCGDVFHGGYIYGLLQGWPFRRVVRFAAACAALKTKALGGRTAIPLLQDVHSFLKDTEC